MARLTSLLLVVVAAGAIVIGVTPALGDVDPASDVLLQQDVFTPYQPEVCSQVKKALDTATRKSGDAGYQVKVAVIASDIDLGAAPQFFGHPSKYAEFLGRELGSFSTHLKRSANVPVLVVMPQGLALWKPDPRVNRVLQQVPIPPHADPNALARAAVKAVPEIATATGHPMAPVDIPGGCSRKDTGGSTILPYAIPIVLLVLVGLLLRFRPAEPRANG